MRDEASPLLAPWEQRVIALAGEALGLWGFKANHGRVWALLYLRGTPLSAAELGRLLELSKGAVSMVTREMEGWGALRRVQAGHPGVWLHEAQTDFLAMIRQVISQREGAFLQRAVVELSAAEAEADRESDPERAERVRRLLRLARLVVQALAVFLQSARFEMPGAAEILSLAQRRCRP